MLQTRQKVFRIVPKCPKMSTSCPNGLVLNYSVFILRSFISPEHLVIETDGALNSSGTDAALDAYRPYRQHMSYGA